MAFPPLSLAGTQCPQAPVTKFCTSCGCRAGLVRLRAARPVIREGGGPRALDIPTQPAPRVGAAGKLLLWVRPLAWVPRATVWRRRLRVGGGSDITIPLLSRLLPGAQDELPGPLCMLCVSV